MSAEPNISDLKDCSMAPVSRIVNPTPMTVRNGSARIVPRVPPTPTPQIPSDGLRLYLDAANPLSYPGTGSTWTDLSSQGKTATLVNSPQFETANGGEFNFVSASTQYATVTGTETSSAMTMIAWIRPNGVQQAWAGILYGRDSGSNVNGLDYRGISGQLTYTWNNLNSSYDFISGLVIPADQWSMVAVAVQPTQAKLYLGTAGTLSSSTNAIPHSTATLQSLDVGRDIGRYFNGRIGVAIVYNRALSDAEMQQVYTALQAR